MSRPSTPRIVAIALFAALPVAASAGDLVRFTFRWPERFSARVEATLDLQRTGARAQQTRGSVRYRYDVSPDGDALRTSVSEFAVATDGPGTTFDDSSGQVLALGALMPSYRVSREGEFLGVQDVARMQRDLRALFAPMLPPDLGAEARARIDRLAGEMLSEASLNNAVAEEWNVLVEAWKDAELEIGETYGSDVESSINLFGEIPVRMNVEVEVLRRMPCRRGGKQRKCVEVELVSTLDPSDMKRVAGRMVEQVAGTGTPLEMDGLALDVTHRITIVLEPDGMLPHRYRLVEAIQVRDPSKPQGEAVAERKERSVEFRYD